MALTFAADTPSNPDVAALLDAHLSLAREVTPDGGVFALEPEALQAPSVQLFSARDDGVLVGIAALQELDPSHAELKSMHTTASARRRGVGRALVHHLLRVAQERGYRRVSLETGNFDAFAPARALYLGCGFQPCAPYGPYVSSPTSACMTIELEPTEP